MPAKGGRRPKKTAEKPPQDDPPAAEEEEETEAEKAARLAQEERGRDNAFRALQQCRRGQVDSEGPANKKQRKAPVNLTTQEVDDLAEWVREHEFLYNKKTDYKNKDKKDRLWEEKTNEMGRDPDEINTWYESMITRFGRLLKKKSGDRAKTDTDREAYIRMKFAFLTDHIVESKGRQVVSVSAIYLFNSLCELISSISRFNFFDLLQHFNNILMP